MRIPNPIKLLPRPDQLASLAKNVASRVPGLPRRDGGAEHAAPLSKPPAKPEPKAKSAAKPKAKSAAKPKRSKAQPKTAPPGVAVSGFPEPGIEQPGDRDPHHALNTPVGEPDPTEWPDPYDRRDDPRDPPDPDGKPFGEDPHPVSGATSTSDPHPGEDPGAQARREKIDRDKLDQ